LTLKPITVAGAGFSGLVTAYLLTKSGREVRVVEKKSRAGGLIQTIRTEHGLVETAANGILNSARLEAMSADIGVPLLHTKRDARKRFIFRGRPRQLPLNPFEALRIPVGFAANAMQLRPRPFETIAEWGRRVVGRGATDYLLVPVLGGIYAGDSERLSASLIFGRAELPAHLQSYRPAKAKVRGTVAPPNGMQQLIDGLRDYLQRKGVEFSLETESEPDISEPTVVCLSASDAAGYLADLAPDVAADLGSIEMLSLLTVTCFFDSSCTRLDGFGCLFPRDQGFRARGVLFNTSIFEGRGPAHAETWIFGGALDGDIVDLTGDEIHLVGARVTRRHASLLERQDYRAIARYAVLLDRPANPTGKSGVLFQMAPEIGFVIRRMLVVVGWREIRRNARQFLIGKRVGAVPDLCPFLFHLAREFLRAKRLDQDLDARLIKIVAAAMPVVNAQDGFDIRVYVPPRQEFADHRPDYWGASHAAADNHPEAYFAGFAALQMQPDVVKGRSRAIFRGAIYGNLELARKECEFRMKG